MARHRRDPERERFWRDAVAGQRKSGLSVRAFCRQRGLNEPNFYAWRRTLDERQGAAPAPFVPVEVVRDAMIEIVVRHGLVVRVPASSEPTAVARLVAALESAPC